MALNTVVSEWQNKPFAYGTADCCLFANACIDAVCGINPAGEWAGKYDTKKGAIKILKKVGGIDTQLDKHFERINPAFTQRGDVCTHISQDGTVAVAVFWGGSWWGMSESGCVRIKTDPLYIWGIAHG